MMVFKFGRGYYHVSLNLGAEMPNFGLRPLLDNSRQNILGPQGTPESEMVWMPYIPIQNHQSHFITIMNRLIESDETEF